MQFQEHILRNLLRRSPVARNPKRDRKDHVLMFPEQRRKVIDQQAQPRMSSLTCTQTSANRNAKSLGNELVPIDRSQRTSCHLDRSAAQEISPSHHHKSGCPILAKLGWVWRSRPLSNKKESGNDQESHSAHAPYRAANPSACLPGVTERGCTPTRTFCRSNQNRWTNRTVWR